MLLLFIVTTNTEPIQFQVLNMRVASHVLGVYYDRPVDVRVDYLRVANRCTRHRLYNEHTVALVADHIHGVADGLADIFQACQVVREGINLLVDAFGRLEEFDKGRVVRSLVARNNDGFGVAAQDAAADGVLAHDLW